jgi:hypothetical protein
MFHGQVGTHNAFKKLYMYSHCNFEFLTTYRRWVGVTSYLTNFQDVDSSCDKVSKTEKILA